MAEVRVLIACHHPIFHGPITGNSFQVYKQQEPNFQYDYVDPIDSNKLDKNGWVYELETDDMAVKCEKRGMDTDSLDEVVSKAEEEIASKRKGTLKQELDKLKQLQGHTNTHIYSDPNWNDIPDNTYDIVYPINCNYDVFANLNQVYRVLKPDGYMITPSRQLRFTKNPPGFTEKTLKLKAGAVSNEFPQFWVTSINGYTINKDNQLIPVVLNELNANRGYGDDRIMIKFTKQSPSQEETEQEALVAMRAGSRKTYRMPRKYSRSYCRKTTCKKMGFTQRSSCRPYKNCFRSGRK